MAFFLLNLTLFLAASLVALAAGAVWMARRSPAGNRLERMLGVKAAPRAGFAARLAATLEPAARLLPPSGKEATRTRLWLIRAGYREPRYARLFFGLRAVLVVAPLLLLLGTGVARRAPVLAVAMPLLGFILPGFVLKRRVAARAQCMRLSLPDVLDLLVICVDAGLGLDQTLQKVALELKGLHPDLCAEFELMLLEMRAGMPRSQALRSLSQRCDVDDLRALTAVLIQTDRFGTSVTQALRVHSAGLRTERRQRAEEAAAKLSIKMLPVLGLFIFPAILIVVLGPAALALIRNLGPLLTQ